MRNDSKTQKIDHGVSMRKVKKSLKEWQDQLSDEEFYVCRQGGTQPPFVGKYTYFNQKGVYLCKCCHNPLFSSQTKFDSKSGWPSFYAPLSQEAITKHKD